MIRQTIGSTARNTTCKPLRPCWKHAGSSMWASCATRRLRKLKGILVTRKPEEELPYIHKLMRLANLSGISTEMDERQLALLDVLSPLNVEARYPLHKSRLLESLTVERCGQMIEETEALLKWIRKQC